MVIHTYKQACHTPTSLAKRRRVLPRLSGPRVSEYSTMVWAMFTLRIFSVSVETWWVVG